MKLIECIFSDNVLQHIFKSGFPFIISILVGIQLIQSDNNNKYKSSRISATCHLALCYIQQLIYLSSCTQCSVQRWRCLSTSKLCFAWQQSCQPSRSFRSITVWMRSMGRGHVWVRSMGERVSIGKEYRGRSTYGGGSPYD